MPANIKLFDSSFLGKLASEVELELIDIGSRGGLLEDFLPVAPFTNAIGFEPDTPECDRLNLVAKSNRDGWKSERHFPVALGETEGSIDLHLASQPGCSSTLSPNMELLTELGRDHDFRIVNSFSMQVEPLDAFCQKQQLQDADFLKVDVQGGELAILRGASKMVSEWLLGIRAEVEFAQLYHNQPQFSEMELHLRQHGFITADWIFQRYWRSAQTAEHEAYTSQQIPYSRGRIVHSDVLFLRDRRWIVQHLENPEKKLARLALIALLYHQVDYALCVLKCIKKGPIGDLVNSVDLNRELDIASKALYRLHFRKKLKTLVRDLRETAIGLFR